MSWWQLLLGSLAVVLGLYAGFVVWLFVLGRRDDARALATFILHCPLEPPRAGVLLPECADRELRR
jgi:hypothetical protein